MDERLKFVVDCQRGEASMAELARVYGVSRKTAYKWLTRFRIFGPAGLLEMSRAPHSRPDAVPEAVAELIVGLRKRHPTWGARKILAALERQRLGVHLPVASTVSALLDRRGLLRHRRRRYRAPPFGGPFAECREPNDVWSADFKGRLLLGSQRVCHPFTLSDNASRYLLRCEGLSRTTCGVVQPLFESAFRDYGLPLAIRTDNGPPFSSVAPGGVSTLAIWLVKLGILPERIAPGKPTQNGRHERIHRTLQEETARPTARTMVGQQRKFDEWRKVYNEERPHEALGQRPPAEAYRSSPRRFPTRLSEPEYGSDIEVRRVRYQGSIKWKGTEIYVSETLRGEPVGLEQVDKERWIVKYGPLLLGELDSKNKLIRPRGRKA